MPTTEQKIKSILKDYLYVTDKDIEKNTTLLNDICSDELDLVEVIMACEEEWEKSITEEEAEKLKTIQDLIDLMDRLSKDGERTLMIEP